MGKFFLRLENPPFLIDKTAIVIQGNHIGFLHHQFTAALIFPKFQFDMRIARHHPHRFRFCPVQTQFKGAVAHDGQKLGKGIFGQAKLLLVKEIGMITHIIVAIGRTCRKHALLGTEIFFQQRIDFGRLLIAPMHLRKVYHIPRAQLPILAVFHGLDKGTGIFHHIEFI